jgi:hypothetical protein
MGSAVPWEAGTLAFLSVCFAAKEDPAGFGALREFGLVVAIETPYLAVE